MTGRRITSIYLPHFAMERWQTRTLASNVKPPDSPALEDVPTVLARDGTHGPVIHAANQAARKNGLLPGSRVVDMHALCPEMRVQDANLEGDRTDLNRLVLWARRWCPWSVADGIDGLILDTTGSDHLFGGEAAMLADMSKRFSSLGLTIHTAIAPTWGAAWALARFSVTSGVACHMERLADDLAPLSVSALRLDKPTVLLLHRLGLKTIGAVANLPRLSLTRRFAKAELAGNPLLRLDQAMGRLAEPVSSPDAPPVFRARQSLPDPIEDPTHVLPQLCADLCDQLMRRECGCRRLHLTIYRSDGIVSSVEVITSRPSRDHNHLLRLFDGRLDKLDPGFGFDLVTLTATFVEPLAVNQTSLDGHGETEGDLPRLVDRLTARLGAQAALRPAPHASHIPERAEQWKPAVSAQTDMSVQTTYRVHTERPLSILARPEPVQVMYAVPEGPPAQFVWRRQTHRIMRHSGPERIAPEWWCDKPGTRLRDYYKIEDESGRRFWLYREGIHGDERGGEPAWFLHGMFA